ncbi:hypothetical protein, partial [Escherichia coli]|uniref:hypothetical protein n=1 Tax=Escherichia coli TaxID=562 RepID=UPI001BEB9E93
PLPDSLCPHRYYKHIGDTQLYFLHNPRIPASSFSEKYLSSLQKKQQQPVQKSINRKNDWLYYQ